MHQVAQLTIVAKQEFILTAPEHAKGLTCFEALAECRQSGVVLLWDADTLKA